MKKLSRVKCAESVIAQGGECENLLCDHCFTTQEKCGFCEFHDGKISLKARKAKRLALAEAYLKRYSRPKNTFKAKNVDSYTKGLKKDYVDIKPLEELKKEIRPNFRQYLRDKVGMKIKLYGNYWMELQQILEEEGVKVVNEYRERNRVILGIATSTLTVMYGAIYLYDKYDEFDKLSGIEYILETDTLVDKVEEPKPIKTVGIDNSDVTLAQHEPVKINIWVQSLFDIDGLIHRGESVPASRETAKEYYFKHIDKWYAKDLFKPSEPTPLQIAKMIRDNGYKCIYKNFDDCRVCPFISAGCGSMEDDAPQESKDRRKKLIDDYISANEPVKDCPVNSEIPQPIKLEKPDVVYAVNGEYIKICHTKGRSVSLDSEGFLLVTTVDGQCRAYATPEQALQVAKKQWGVK